jgi:transposase
MFFVKSSSAQKKMKRKLKILEHRRLEGARLLMKGITKADIARQLGVSRQSVQNWATRLTLKRKSGVGGTISSSFQLEQTEFLKNKKIYKSSYTDLRCQPLGRPKKLTNNELQKLKRVLKKGAKAIGSKTDIWTLSKIQSFIQEEYLEGQAISRTYVLHLMKKLGFSFQKPSLDDELLLRKWERFGWIEV